MPRLLMFSELMRPRHGAFAAAAAGATAATRLPGLVLVGFVFISALVLVLGVCAHSQHKNSDSSNCKASSSESEGSWDRSGSLEGCITPIATPKVMKKLQWLTKSKESRRQQLLQLEEEYRKQDEMFWEEDSGAVWQKAILMGEKCEPPAFSGLILYDERGKRVPQFPARPFKAVSPVPIPTEVITSPTISSGAV